MSILEKSTVIDLIKTRSASVATIAGTVAASSAVTTLLRCPGIRDGENETYTLTKEAGLLGRGSRRHRPVHGGYDCGRDAWRKRKSRHHEREGVTMKQVLTLAGSPAGTGTPPF